MKRGAQVLLVLFWVVAVALPCAAEEEGVIQLRSRAAPETPVVEPSPGKLEQTDPLSRAFDHSEFETRLHSLWFQRKALLADGRTADAQRHAERIRAFCAEEGVRRLEFMAGALVAEAGRYLEEGRHEQALDSLNFAAAFDPGRPQVHLLRAAVFWRSGQGYLSAGAELLAAVGSTLKRSLRDMSLFSIVGVVLVLALLGCVAVFSLVMLLRYNVPFRHEVEEWLGQALHEPWARLGGWAILTLPLLLWFSAGWVAIYWIVVTFRFMRSSERVTATVLLVATALSVPLFGVGAALYGMTADPMVRATVASAEGGYDPDRLIKLQRLVNAHPDEATYHFLLAGLYKRGRYIEQAFEEYKAALEIDPFLEEAYLNIGNIFYDTRQHAEAIANYRKALELNPQSVLAHFNSHLAQSQAFRFKEAEASLTQARQIDPQAVAGLLAGAEERSSRPQARDATLQAVSIWRAALQGQTPAGGVQPVDAGPAEGRLLLGLFNPVSIIALLALLCCGVVWIFSRANPAARRCIRCGGAFCSLCKSTREGQEYCSQCYHIFVRGDGLAPAAKNQKLYQVERFERRHNKGRRWISLLVPGTGQLLRGRPGRGVLLLLLWFFALIVWQPVVMRPVERMLGIDLRLELLRPGSVPAMFDVDPHAFLAILLLAVTWFLANIWRWRSREA